MSGKCGQSKGNSEKKDNLTVDKGRFFDPTAHGLSNKFQLTKFGDLKTGRCWIHEELLHLQMGTIQRQFQVFFKKCCSTIALSRGGQCQMQKVGFFYPIVDDPYLMGRIACASVLSNLYVCGIVKCDRLFMLLGVSGEMTEKECDIVIPMLTNGFSDNGLEAGVVVSEAEPVINPVCNIGGLALSICQPDAFIDPGKAIAGDVLVLTKPLGTQFAVNAFLGLGNSECCDFIKSIVSEADVQKAYKQALDSMCRLNRVAACLLHEHNAHAVIDVTAFGLLGNAETLALQQKNDVSFVIHTLPIISKMAELAKASDSSIKLLEGRSSEVSGGLLVCLPIRRAVAYCKNIQKLEGCAAWIVGIVERGYKKAYMINKPRIIDVLPND